MQRSTSIVLAFIAGIAVYDLLVDAGPGSLIRYVLALFAATAASLAVFYLGERLRGRRAAPPEPKPH